MAPFVFLAFSSLLSFRTCFRHISVVLRVLAVLTVPAKTPNSGCLETLREGRRCEQSKQSKGQQAKPSKHGNVSKAKESKGKQAKQSKAKQSKAKAKLPAERIRNYMAGAPFNKNCFGNAMGAHMRGVVLGDVSKNRVRLRSIK